MSNKENAIFMAMQVMLTNIPMEVILGRLEEAIAVYKQNPTGEAESDLANSLRGTILKMSVLSKGPADILSEFTKSADTVSTEEVVNIKVEDLLGDIKLKSDGNTDN